MTFELITPLGNSNSSGLYSTCLLVLLGCTFFILCFVFSLFWDIIKVVVVKRSAKYKIVKVVLFLITMFASGLYAGLTRSTSVGFMHFLSDSLKVSWIVAFSLSLLASVGLLVFVYKEECSDVQAVPLLPIFAIFIVFTILSPISFKMVGASVGAICFAFFYPLVTVTIIIYICFRGCRRTGGEHFVIRKRFALLFSVAYGAVLLLVITSRITCGSDCQIKTFNGSQSFKAPRFESGDVSRGGEYPICGKTWSSLKLNVADLAFLANLAYQIDKEKMVELNNTVNDYFRQRALRWNVTFMSASSNPTFYHLFEERARVHVIGIRGTQDTVGDWFENLKIWSEIATYQVMAVALPVQKFPLEFISYYVNAASFLERILHHNEPNYYFKAIESYVTGINRNQSEVLLVGHSLGGGLAKLIGARSKIPAVSFSSPGEVYNHLKFGYELSDLQTYTTSIIAHSDMLTWIDKHGGLVQFIECDSSNFAQCHSIRNTYCELKRSCRFSTPVKC